MSSKSLRLFALSLFVVVLVMGFGSATINFVSVTGATQSIVRGNTATVSFQLKEMNTGNLSNMSFNVPLTLNSGSNTLVSAGSVTGMVTTLNQNITSGTMSLTFTVPSSQSLGTYTGNLTLTGQYTNTVTYNLPVTITVTAPQEPSEIQTCSGVGMPADMDVRVKKIDFTNNGLQYMTLGDDNSWFPFEDIEAKIEMKNYGDFDADNVEVSWGLYDTDKQEWVIEPDSEKDFRLKHGDTETLTVNFKVDDDVDMDLTDVTDGEHYKFYVYADGVVDDKDSVNDGKDFCTSSFEDTEIVVESNFVILNNLNIPETVQCGATVDVTGDVWNVGDEDQSDVTVDVYDKERKFIDDLFSVGDVDALDKQSLSFSFKIPKDAEEKTHILTFRVLDDNNGVYQDDFDDDESIFTVPLIVSGGCGASSSQVLVAANTVSGGKAGQDLVVRATITNTGTSQAVYTANVAGSESWASSFSMDQSSLILGAGQSKDVTITFHVNKDAAGSQTFSIELLSDQGIITQPVSVTIEKSSGFGGITGGALGSNWYIWGIGLLNLILVIVIIIVAVRIARRK